MLSSSRAVRAGQPNSSIGSQRKEYNLMLLPDLSNIFDRATKQQTTKKSTAQSVDRLTNQIYTACGRRVWLNLCTSNGWGRPQQRTVAGLGDLGGAKCFDGRECKSPNEMTSHTTHVVLCWVPICSISLFFVRDAHGCSYASLMGLFGMSMDFIHSHKPILASARLGFHLWLFSPKLLAYPW